MQSNEGVWENGQSSTRPSSRHKVMISVYDNNARWGDQDFDVRKLPISHHNLDHKNSELLILLIIYLYI
jgi:hypothetical protein